MNIKAFISINLVDGSSIKYVNPVVTDTHGKNGEYYGYSNEAGDQFANQTGAGKVSGDYTSLLAQFGETGLVVWPETGTVLVRKNKDNSVAALSQIRTSLNKKAIASIQVIEQEINEFQQLDYTGIRV